MKLVLHKIRNGSFFLGPKDWLRDEDTYYEFRLGTLVRHRIQKGAIDSTYEMPLAVGLFLLPLLLILAVLRLAVVWGGWVLLWLGRFLILVLKWSFRF